MIELWVFDCGTWYLHSKGALVRMQAMAADLEAEGEQTRLRGR